MSSNQKDLEKEIERLKKVKGFSIVSHYFTNDEVQRVSDFVADSLELALSVGGQESASVVVCTTSFMVEIAKILNPHKKILTPLQNCQCRMVSYIREEHVRKARKQYPGAPLVLYFNSPNRIKLMADALCTASTALQVVNSSSFDDHPVLLFGPDKHIAHYLAENSSKEIVSVCDGFCHVHQYREKDLKRQMEEYPDARVVMHPECASTIQKYAHFIGGTTSIRRYVEETGFKVYLIGCDYNLTRLIQKENPEKRVLSIDPVFQCEEMRMFNLENIYRSLSKDVYEIKLNLTPNEMDYIRQMLLDIDAHVNTSRKVVARG
jgi:quinolinate synthase